jgi:cytoskeletal protein RodZ
MVNPGPTPKPVAPTAELLPSRDARRARRRRDRRRPILAALIACAVGGAVVVAIVASRSGSGSEPGRAERSHRPPASTEVKGAETSRRPSTTVTSAPSSVSSSATTDTTPSAAANEATAPNSAAAPNADQIQARMRITTAKCNWDAQSGNVSSSGVITNHNADGYRVYYSVSWMSDDGYEVASAAAQDWVDAGDSIDWELDNGADEAPVGLHCEASVEVLG